MHLKFGEVMRKTTRASIITTIRSAPTVVNLTWYPQKTNFFQKEKEMQKVKTEKHISYPEVMQSCVLPHY
jgi:hypothetical protein